MKNIGIKLSILLLAAPLAVSFANAQVSTSSPDKDTKIDISLPMQKDDFLLFYGVTKDEDKNSKITALRKDFINKFQELKEEYNTSFKDIVGDSELSPSVAVESVQEIKGNQPVKSLKADVKNIKTTAVTSVKKYSIDEKEIITPIVNVINDKATIHTENSSWFQKVKSWFNW